MDTEFLNRLSLEIFRLNIYAALKEFLLEKSVCPIDKRYRALKALPYGTKHNGFIFS